MSDNLFNIDMDNFGKGINDLDKSQETDKQTIVVDTIEDTDKGGEKSKDKKDNLIIVDVPVEQKDTEKEKVDAPASKQKGSLLSPLAAAVKEKGILPDLNVEEFNKVKEEERADFLLGAIDKHLEDSIDAGIEAYKESLSPQGAKYLTMLENGVSEEQAYQITAGQIKYKDLDEEKLKGDEKLQEKAVYDYYKLTTRFSDDKIKGIITDKKATSELEKEASTCLPEIKKIYANAEKEALAQAKENEELSRQEAVKQFEALKKSIYDTKEIIPYHSYKERTG
jgi:hypothetical protein